MVEAAGAAVAAPGKELAALLGDGAVLDPADPVYSRDATETRGIEGHADARGTTEYNLALGERRADAAKNYLLGQGVPASRITIVSYGKARPVCHERNYTTTKNKRTMTDKLVLPKFCPRCRKHTDHKETK